VNGVWDRGLVPVYLYVVVGLDGSVWMRGHMCDVGGLDGAWNGARCNDELGYTRV
jgi:hypothetical protein